MQTPTDQQIDLISKHLTAWAIVADDGDNLLEVFSFEDTANAKLARIRANGKGQNWHVRSITWKPSRLDVKDAQRAMEAWIRGGSDFSPANAEQSRDDGKGLPT